MKHYPEDSDIDPFPHLDSHFCLMPTLATSESHSRYKFTLEISGPVVLLKTEIWKQSFFKTL